MKFRLFRLLVPLALIAACATTGPAVNRAAAPGTAAVVNMQPNLRFSPTPITSRAGDTVEFRNLSAFAHSVSTRPTTREEAALTALPAGAESFDSGDIPAGKIFRHTFGVAGTYRYFCRPHHGLGMVGTIVVTAG